MRAHSLQLCLTLCELMDWAHEAPLSMGFSRQEYWSGLPCPPPGGLPSPGIERVSLAAPVIQVDSLPLSYQGSPLHLRLLGKNIFYLHSLRKHNFSAIRCPRTGRRKWRSSGLAVEFKGKCSDAPLAFVLSL